MASCDVCNSTFATSQAAKQHKKNTRHCVCPHCDKPLASSHGLQAHRVAVGHWYACPKCADTFAEKRLLTDHQKSTGHCYCGDCNQIFGTAVGLKDHLKSSRHPTEFRCCDCDRDFNSTGALEQHLRDKVHHQGPSAAQRLELLFRNAQSNTQTDADGTVVAVPGVQCTECPRTFKTKTALAQHLDSLAHKPLGEFACFAGSSCGAAFTSPSAVLHHLESGTCPSGLDREQMRALITKHDVDRLVTQLPTYMSVKATADEVPLLLRSLSSLSLSSASEGLPTPTDGSIPDCPALIESPAPRCPFCPPERRPFQNATALRQHLASAAHSEPFIYCPIALSGGTHGPVNAVRQFTTVAGLAQHLESGKCVGGVGSFWEAVRYMETRFQDMGMQLKLVQGGAM